MMIQVGDGPRGLRRRGTKQEEKKRQTGGKEVPNRRKKGTKQEQKKEHLNEGLGYQ